MHKTSYYIINGITFYRLLAAPALMLLIFIEQEDWFKRLLAFSFFTDAIDGFLARKCKAVSIMLSTPSKPLFYLAIGITGLYLIEETIMILRLAQWQADIKGLYPVLKQLKNEKHHNTNK